MVIFPFGMKKRSFHKDEVRFSWEFVGYDTDSDMSIEERPSLFLSGIAFVVGVKIVIGVELVILSARRNRVTFLVAFLVAITVAVTVLAIVTVAVAVAIAIFIAFRSGITANVAARIGRHSGLVVTPPFPMMATVTLGLVRILPALRGCADRHVLKRFARLIGIVEFDPGIK